MLKMGLIEDGDFEMRVMKRKAKKHKGVKRKRRSKEVALLQMKIEENKNETK